MNKKIANKVAIHQPNFFPWLGYFECIDIVDMYIFLDDVPFGSKPKRMNRNFISNHKGEKKNFTMSVSTPSLDSEIRDCKVVRAPFFFHYRDLLKEFTKKKMLCTNPDLIVHRGLKVEYCAGTIAEIFKKLGGEVVYFGKPYSDIYNFCLKKNENILAIGDNIRTDIKGANKMKFDSLFITSGIHKKEFFNLSFKDYDKVLDKYEVKTNFYLEKLNW